MTINGSASRDSILSVRESIERMHSWMSTYVRSELGPGASPSDFMEQLEARVAKRLQKEEWDSRRLDSVVESVLRDLVGQYQRKVFRREELCRYDSTENLDRLPDRSPSIAERLENESLDHWLRTRIPAELIPVIDNICGYSDDELTIKELAHAMGIQPNTLHQRLHRLYRKLQRDLREFKEFR